MILITEFAVNVADSLLVNHDKIVVIQQNDAGSGIKSLVTLLIVNIALMLISFGLDFFKAKKENYSYRIRKISDESIIREKEVFDMFTDLALVENNQDLLLAKIEEISSYMGVNKLFFEKKYYSICNEYLDYFKTLVFDYKRKDIKEEERFIDRLCKKYYGE